MYYSRSIFTQFADFDTEHTRFASKYSLYLYREGGFDEDPEVMQLKEGASPCTLTFARSKVSLSSSYLEMLEAINKSGRWHPNPLNTTTIS